MKLLPILQEAAVQIGNQNFVYNNFWWVDPKGKILKPTKDEAMHDEIIERLFDNDDQDYFFKKGYVRVSARNGTDMELEFDGSKTTSNSLRGIRKSYVIVKPKKVRVELSNSGDYMEPKSYEDLLKKLKKA